MVECEVCQDEKYVLGDDDFYHRCPECYMSNMRVKFEVDLEYETFTTETVQTLVASRPGGDEVSAYLQDVQGQCQGQQVAYIQTMVLSQDMFAVVLAKEVMGTSKPVDLVNIDDITDMFFNDPKELTNKLRTFGLIIRIESALHRGNVLALEKLINVRKRSRGPTLILSGAVNFYTKADDTKESAKAMFDKLLDKMNRMVLR